jgi:hypothetical protein
MNTDVNPVLGTISAAAEKQGMNNKDLERGSTATPVLDILLGGVKGRLAHR